MELEAGDTLTFRFGAPLGEIDSYIDPETGKLELQKARPIVYSHGEYFALGRMLGYFGWSVRRKKRIKRERQPDKMKK